VLSSDSGCSPCAGSETPSRLPASKVKPGLYQPYRPGLRGEMFALRVLPRGISESREPLLRSSRTSRVRKGFVVQRRSRRRFSSNPKVPQDSASPALSGPDVIRMQTSHT